MAHYELVSWSATQPNTGLAATAFTGDSLTVKNNSSLNNRASTVRVIAIWANQQVDGFQRIIVPSGHDTNRNMQFAVEAADQSLRYPVPLPWDLHAQETMQITIAGSNTAGDVETGHALLYYSDLPGVTQRGITYSDLMKKWKKPTTVYATITGSGAGYSGSELITADSDLLHANTDYAIIGVTTSVPVGAVTIIGPDTGNVKIGVPGSIVHTAMCNEFFMGLARAHEMPFIPVINSGNKSSTFLGIAMNENAGSTPVSLQLMEL